jgi:hypothetical protein
MHQRCPKCGAELCPDGTYELARTRDLRVPLAADDPEMTAGWQNIPFPPEHDAGWTPVMEYDSDKHTLWRRPRCRAGRGVAGVQGSSSI